jgi:hypothetical protein
VGAQWSNYSIGFFKIIDFMVNMGSFNIQMNQKNEFSNCETILSKQISKSEFEKYFLNFAAQVLGS